MADKNPIKELRDAINITQRELADALEVHHSYIANLESNLVNFDEEDLGEQSKIKMVFDKLAKWSNQDEVAESSTLPGEMHRASEIRRDEQFFELECSCHDLTSQCR